MDENTIIKILGNGTSWGRMEPLLNIGFGNTVPVSRLVAIVTPNSAPMKRLKDKALADDRLIDITCGRRTRAILIMDSNHVILSAIQAETLSQRYLALVERRPDEAVHE
jgi:regulator of extracellular matrix RemA (YlzA/DUF370 family)